MGKLHTLKRAIERNPEDWYSKPFPFSKFRVKGASRSKRYRDGVYLGDWKPDYWSYSYRPFIKKVLEGIGISDNGQGE